MAFKREQLKILVRLSHAEELAALETLHAYHFNDDNDGVKEGRAEAGAAYQILKTSDHHKGWRKYSQDRLQGHATGSGQCHDHRHLFFRPCRAGGSWPQGQEMTREQLEILVRLVHSEEIAAFEYVGGWNHSLSKQFLTLDAQKAEDLIADLLEKNGYSIFGEFDLRGYVRAVNDIIVIIASLSSLPTIQEAYQDYVRTVP